MCHYSKVNYIKLKNFEVFFSARGFSLVSILKFRSGTNFELGCSILRDGFKSSRQNSSVNGWAEEIPQTVRRRIVIDNEAKRPEEEAYGIFCYVSFSLLHTHTRLHVLQTIHHHAILCTKYKYCNII